MILENVLSLSSANTLSKQGGNGMKKWLSLIMVLAMLVCVTACGAKPDASDKNNEEGRYSFG